MKDKITIRLPSETKQKIMDLAGQKGFKSTSDFARQLIEKGIEKMELSPSEYHLLGQSTQSVMLLREILSAISSDQDTSNKVINDIKSQATDWVEQFNTTIR